eukprot:2954943-Pyramimonas_sp.AAC.1
MYGGAAQKPTGLLSNLLGPSEGLHHCDGNRAHDNVRGKNDQGIFASRRLQSYPSGLCRFFGWCITRIIALMRLESGGPGGWRRPSTAQPRTSQWSGEAEGPLGGKFVMLNEKYSKK